MKFVFILIMILISNELISQTYQIKKYVMGSSAQTVTDANYKIMSTVGQPAIGITQNAGNTAKIGFWNNDFIPSLLKHLIILNSGWNLISSYIEPENKSIPVVWNEVKDNVVIVKNNAGASYIPAFDIDDIKNWNIIEGYQVYASKKDTLEVTGNQIVPESSPINLNAGWNIISYLRNSVLDCETAFATITDNGNLVIVKDNYGNTYIPAYFINTIGNLIPGQGYQIYVLNNDVLTYPAN